MTTDPLTLADLTALTPAQLRLYMLDLAQRAALLTGNKIYPALVRQAWLALDWATFDTLCLRALGLPRPLPGDHALNYARTAVLWALAPDGDALAAREVGNALTTAVYYRYGNGADQRERARQRAVVAALQAPAVESRAA